jgi:hypothetical protein
LKKGGTEADVVPITRRNVEGFVKRKETATMLTQSHLFLRRNWVALGFLGVVVAVLLLAGPALADVDLSDGVSSATSSFKSIIKTVFSIAAIVVVGGLVLSAFKFTQRDPHATQYLVGTIAAGAICGIVSGIL